MIKKLSRKKFTDLEYKLIMEAAEMETRQMMLERAITEQDLIRFEQELADGYEEYINQRYINYDMYKETDIIPNIPSTECLGYKIYGGIVDIERDVNLFHKDNIYSVVTDIFKKNVYDIHLRHILKFYGSGEYVSIRHIRISDYLMAHLSPYINNKNYQKNSLYGKRKFRDKLWKIFNPYSFNCINKVWRIKINPREFSWFEYIFSARKHSYFKEMGLIRKLQFKQYVEDSKFHEFKYYFLFSDMLFCVTFFIIHKDTFGFRAGLDNHLIYDDTSKGLKYYLTEFVNCIEVPYFKVKNFLLNESKIIKEKIVYLNRLYEDFTIENKDPEQIVFDVFDNDLQKFNFLFKWELEKRCRMHFFKVIKDKNWIRDIFFEKGYLYETCIFSSFWILSPFELLKGFDYCFKALERSIYEISKEKERIDEVLNKNYSQWMARYYKRLFFDENILEYKMEVIENNRKKEERDEKRRLWVIQKIKEIDARNEAKRLLIEERKQYLIEKRKRAYEKRVLLENQKKWRKKKQRMRRAELKAQIERREERRKQQDERLKIEDERREEKRKQKEHRLKKEDQEKEDKKKTKEERLKIEEERREERKKQREEKQKIEEERREERKKQREERQKIDEERRQERQAIREEKLKIEADKKNIKEERLRLLKWKLEKKNFKL